MKKLFTFLSVSIVLFLNYSCSNDDSSGPTLVNEPEANVAFDASSFGVYKGVFVGSSGVITIDINNDAQLGARMVLDDQVYDFTADQTLTPGASINALTFTCGAISFNFYVNANGSNAYVSDIIFEGHSNATIQIVKELSDQQVFCYKGTYNGDSSGAFDLIISGDEIYGLSRSNSSDEVLYITGDIDGNSVSGTFDNGSFTGTKNGNKISGQWESSEDGNASWTAQRKI